MPAYYLGNLLFDGQPEAALERAEHPLGEPQLAVVVLLAGVSRALERQHAVVDLDLHVVAVHAGQLGDHLVAVTFAAVRPQPAG